MTVGLTFSTFSTDDFSGSGVTPGTYQPGPRLIGEFALTRAVGRSPLSFVAWDYYRTAGDTNEVTDPRTQENVLNAEVRWGIPVARRVQVEPLIGYRQYDLKALTGGRMYSGAVTARFGLSDRMSVPAWPARSTRGGWLRNRFPKPTSRALASRRSSDTRGSRAGQQKFLTVVGGGIRGFYPKLSRDIARRTVKEAEEVRAELLLTDCLSCKHNLKQGVPFEGKLKVLTTPEYLLEGIETGRIQFSKKD